MYTVYELYISIYCTFCDNKFPRYISSVSLSHLIDVPDLRGELAAPPESEGWAEGGSVAWE